MAGSVNKVILIGHLGKDPEVRSTQSGNKVCTLRLATSESWKDKQTGERQERTQWHSVVIFNDNLTLLAERYLKKGSKVYVEGQLETRKWQDQQGQERYTTEVVLRQFRGGLTLLDGRREGDDDRGDDHDRGYGGGQQLGGGQQHRGNDGGNRGGGDYGGGGQPRGGWNPGGGRPAPDADLDDEIPF